VVPLLHDAKTQWSTPAVSQVMRPTVPEPAISGYSLRNERYRYTSWQGTTAGEELYDYQADPRELVNLAQAPIARELKAFLKAATR
jgi:iduronate 2-sulfatase